MSFENQISEITHDKSIDVLLKPSWLSGLLAIVAALVVTVGSIVAFSFHNSSFDRELTSLQNTSSPALTLPGQAPPGTTQNSLQNTWPLLAFWGVIGLIVYFVVMSVVETMRKAEELKQELNYVHAHRDQLIRTTAESLAVRLLAIIIWLVFIEIFFKRIIPYSILAAHASVSDLRNLQSLLYALVSFLMIAISMHLHAIFLRLILKRTRVFSDGYIWHN